MMQTVIFVDRLPILTLCWISRPSAVCLYFSDIFHIFKTKYIFLLLQVHWSVNSEISVASTDLIVGVVDIAISFSQVHRLRLDPLVPAAHLGLSTVVGVPAIPMGRAGAVATVGNVHMHWVKLLDGRVDVVPQGRSGSCTKNSLKAHVSICHCHFQL